MPEFFLKDMYDEMRQLMRAHSIENDDFIAREIIKNKLDICDVNIIYNENRAVTGICASELRDNTNRIIKGEPLNRVLGESAFWGLRFKVTDDVLDPRNDTEVLVDLALKKLTGTPPHRILDMGTGSGCIIISLLHEWSKSIGVASDISEKALKIAEFNARQNNVADRLALKKSNWGDSLDGKFDLIVSNPPYICETEMPNLPESVKNYDPILALEAGKDGLDAYKKIIFDIKTLLQADGLALLEIGFSQAQDVMRIVEDSGLLCKGVHKDLAGNPRVVEISFGEK